MGDDRTGHRVHAAKRGEAVKIQEIALAAGQVYTHVANGLYFRVLTGDVSFIAIFQLASGRREKTEVISGLGFGFPEPYTQIEIQSDVTQIIEVVTAAIPVDDSRLSGAITVETAAQIVDAVDISCANGARTTVLAQNSARKTAIITNNDPANTIRVGGSAVVATSGTPLQAGMTLSLDTTAEVCVWNQTGAAVTVSRQEVTA